MKHRWRMLFRIGMTLVIFTAVVMFYLNNFFLKEEVNKQEEHRETDLQFENKVSELDKKDEDIALVKTHKDGGIKVFDGYMGSEEKSKKYREESSKKPVEAKQTEGENKEHPTDLKGLQPVIRRRGSQLDGTSNTIHLSVVACGDRGPETVVMLKSAVVLTSSILVLHIFAEDMLHKYFHDQLEFWPETYKDHIEYRIYNITLPQERNLHEKNVWLNLFKPCASQRLFLPVLLSDVDSLIYVDTDVLFVSPPEKLWKFFSRFNSSQIAALAPEHEDGSISWYARFARHPFYGPYGVNSGVMLMNLTRIRESFWLLAIVKHYREYHLKITWGDQDLINIYFSYHPDQLYVFSCNWNYRPDHCMYMSNCKVAEETGAYVLHGCRRVMHNDKQPAFRAVYEAFRDHRLGDDLQYHLLERVKKNLHDIRNNGNCGQVPHIFTKQLEKLVSQARQATKAQLPIE